MPTVKSSARAFFEFISSKPDPFAFLSSIPDSITSDSPFFEEEWLEFKGWPQHDKDARSIWSKALSGFANITEGMIVWGIDARKTSPRGIDAACGLKLLPDPVAFESKLRDWVRDATNPPVVGVEYKGYAGPNREGFVLCLVPESGHKPHRAEWADKQYYYRAGDDFLPAQPGLLRTLFYPQKSCWIAVNLRMHYELVYPDWPHLPPSPKMNVLATLSISGSSTGRDVYLTMCSEPPIGTELGIGKDWHYLPTENKKLTFQATRPLQPGEEVPLFNLRELRPKPELRLQNQHWVLSWQSLEFEFEVFVADQERTSLRLVLEAGTSPPGQAKGVIEAKLLSTEPV